MIFHRRKRTGKHVLRRNLLLAFSVMAITGGLALWLNLRDRAVPMLLPERHDPKFQMEQRNSPDNAYHLLKEAEEMVERSPEEIREAVRAAQEDMRVQFRPYASAPGDFLGVARADAASPMRDYLMRWAPAVTKMREALQKPYYLNPWPPNKLDRTAPHHFPRLTVVALGHAAVLAHSPETIRPALELLLDCIRLSRWLWKEEADEIYSRAIEEHAHAILAVAMHRPHAAEHLPWLQEQLAQLGPPFANRQALIEQFWMAMDNTQTYEIRSYEPEDVVLAYQRWRDTRYRIKRWMPVRHKVIEMANAPLSMCNHIMHGDPQTHDILEDNSTRLWFNIGLVREAAYQDLYYTRTLTLLALERYRVKHGAYPTQLEQLVPDFLATLPLDNISAMPLHYQGDGAAVSAYALGENRQFDGGAEDDLLVLQLPLP